MIAARRRRNGIRSARLRGINDLRLVSAERTTGAVGDAVERIETGFVTSGSHGKSFNRPPN